MFFRVLFSIALLLFFSASFFALVIFDNWPLSLLEQFKLYFTLLQITLTALIVLSIASTRRFNKRYALLSIFLSGLTIYSLQEFLIYLPAQQTTIPKNNYTLLHLNVLGTNQQINKAVAIIRNTDADIVTLVEYNAGWQKGLEASGAFKPYPYRYTVRFGNDGIYSKIPLTACKTEWFSQRQNRVTTCDLKISKKPATLALVHPKPPVKRQWHERQKELFGFLAKNRSRYHQDLILVGDLNTAPWTRSFKALCDKTQLQDSRAGFGLFPTWQSDKWPIILPIDYILVSPGVEVLSIKTGNKFGSDHLPLITQFHLKGTN